MNTSFETMAPSIETTDDCLRFLSGYIVEVSAHVRDSNVWLCKYIGNKYYRAVIHSSNNGSLEYFSAYDVGFYRPRKNTKSRCHDLNFGNRFWGTLLIEPLGGEDISSEVDTVIDQIVFRMEKAMTESLESEFMESEEAQLRKVVENVNQSDVSVGMLDEKSLSILARKFNASGALYCYQDQITSIGDVPGLDEIGKILGCVCNKGGKSIFRSSNINADLGLTLLSEHMGVMGIPLSQHNPSGCFIFRPQVSKFEEWIGSEMPHENESRFSAKWEMEDVYKASILKNILLERFVEKSIQEKAEFFESSKRMYYELQQVSEVASKTASGVFIANERLEIIWSNHALTTLTGYTESELVGTQPDRLFFDFDNVTSVGLLEEISEQDQLEKECRIVCQSPDPLWVKLELTPTLRPDSGHMHYVVIMTDIDEIKRAEQEISIKNKILSQTNSRLKSSRENAEFLASQARIASEAKGKFLNTISHELLTPLNGVVGMASLLRESPLDGEQYDCTSTILDCGNSLTDLIHEILDYTKLENGVFNLMNNDFSMEDLITDSIKRVRAQAFENQISLEYAIDDNLPNAMLGDNVRIKQVLVNLLSNAVKFTDRGKVKVTVSGNVLLENIYNLTFLVEDTGIGIPLEKQPLIFDLFSQLDNSHSRKFGGTGLGLSICKKIISAMGGDISVRSQEGVGSAFTFTLQCKSQEEYTKGSTFTPWAEANSTHPLDKTSSILVVEDNPINREVAVRVLETLGYDADVAIDGAMGLNMYRENKYDVIFMDLHMPTMDGMNATRLIRKLSNNSKVPHIIALTANVLPEHRIMAFESGMNEFMSKPIDPRIMKSTLEAIELANDDDGSAMGS